MVDAAVDVLHDYLGSSVTTAPAALSAGLLRTFLSCTQPATLHLHTAAAGVTWVQRATQDVGRLAMGPAGGKVAVVCGYGDVGKGSATRQGSTKTLDVDAV